MSASSCSRCSRAASTSCASCRDHICDSHSETSGHLARNVFAASLIPHDQALCSECYRERFWLAARGAIALVAVVVLLITLIQRAWIGAAVALAINAVWFIAAGKLARRAIEDRAHARAAKTRAETDAAP